MKTHDTKQQKRLPPFPRLGEIYRTLALALDTKHNDRTVDRLAREGDYDWSLLPTLGDDLIVTPLRKYTDEEFGDFLVQFIRHIHNEYLTGLVQRIGIEALSREETLPLLVEHYFSLHGSSVLYWIREKFKGPDLHQLFDSQQQPIAVVFDWIDGNKGRNLAKTVFPDTNDTNRPGREMVRRWAEQADLPDITSIRTFCDKLEKLGSPEQQQRVVDLRRWLVIARALSWLDKRSPIPLRQQMHHHLLLGYPSRDIGRILSEAVQQSGQRLAMLNEPVFSLCFSLDTRKKKEPGTKAETKERLMNLNRLVAEHDHDGRKQYMVEWLWGRWHVLSGSLEQAVDHYREAAELANYRAGENQKKITEEALALAGHLKDKILIKQLKHRAIVFGLFVEPKNGDVVEGWEIDQFQKAFGNLFPSDGWFPEARSAENQHRRQLPFLFLDAEEANKKADFRNPNRKFTMHGIDEQTRRWLQLGYFVTSGKFDEVKKLLDQGASVDQLDDSGESALLAAINHAIQTGKRDILDLLLLREHKRETLNAATAKRLVTPLILAVELGEPDVVERLVKMGATVDRRGSIDNLTPLYRCIGILSGVLDPRALQSRLAKPPSETPDPSERETLRRYCGDFSGMFGDGQHINALLEDPRNRRLFDALVSVTTKSTIARHTVPKLLKIAEILLGKGADPNARHDSPAPGRTPLMLAAEINSQEAFTLMMKHGGIPEQADDSGADCFRIAVAFSSDKIVRLLTTEKPPEGLN